MVHSDIDDKMLKHIETLVKRALDPEEYDLEEVMYSLSKAVKLYEILEWGASNPYESIEESLPKLVPYLINENEVISGCTLSIFRRVKISAETVDVAVELFHKNPEARFIVETIPMIVRGLDKKS